MMLQHSDPVCLATVDVSSAGPNCKMLFGDLNNDGRLEMVMIQPDNRQDVRYIPHQVQCITVFDPEGRMLWQRGTPDDQAGTQGSDYPAQVYDLDGDGRLEVLCVMNDQFHVIDGLTGESNQAYDLPSPEAHDCIIIANLSGNERPTDLLLKDRYHQIWALNSHFELLWTHQGNPGHFPWVYDINGDGKDEVMAGYDMLDSEGNVIWSCQDLSDHADCIWVGDVNGDGEIEIVIGGSVTVMMDKHGTEVWRYADSIESQHIALGRFRDDLPGLQIAGLDRIIRGDGKAGVKGKDGMFMLDANGQEIWKEHRQTDGWLTIIDTISGWDESGMDYILAYRRGGGIFPTLYDGDMNVVAAFPVDGYVGHANFLGNGREQIAIYDGDTIHIYSSHADSIAATPGAKPIVQTKRLYSSTIYMGGEVVKS